MSDLAAAHAGVLRRIAAACARARRDPATVTLVAVSKTVPVETIRALAACGQTVFGENRVQEALAKMPEVGGGARWHLVGHLQKNKARHAVGAFEMIHSVDDVEPARELDRRAADAGIVQPILLQVNVSREATKEGVEEEDLAPLVDAVAALSGLRLRGLMCIPAPSDDPEQSRPAFARLRELLAECAARIGRPLPDLSMGMTDDFETAVEEGATLVRVGRALFGERGQTPFPL